MVSFYWLSGHPKSGNNWLTDLINYANLGDEYDPVNRRQDLPLGIVNSRKMADHVLQKEKPFFRIEKPFCRDNLQPINGSKPKAVIYLVRHPLEVMCSFYNHQLLMGRYYDSFDSYIDQYLDCGGLTVAGNWCNHITGWVDQNFLPVHIIKYEDLLLDTCITLENLYSFIGFDLENDDIQKAIEKFSFQVMKEKQEELISQGKQTFDSSPADKNSLQQGRRFINSGRIDSYKEKLTEDQIKKGTEVFAPMMKRFGYEN